MTEFRMSAVIQLPSDEFERAAAIMECGKAKAALLKILAEHKLSAAVTHETVTPRVSKPPVPTSPTAGHAPHDPAVPLRGRAAAE